MENSVTKNDQIWNKLFEQYNILDEIEKNGYYEITAEQIKDAGREPRLMTKFDSSENLPATFKINKLAILPTQRGTYFIGKFNNYENIQIDNNIEVETKRLPEFITTIDYKNISSEAISLSSAYISKMIEDVVGEEVVPTIQGRMGTGEFSYQIKVLDEDKEFTIDVKNSQMEIDGSYEGISKFAIIEAKNHYMNDFIVRQLYYPYRVWKKITNKEIIPIMLIKHDNIFNFFVYKFEDENRYNSIKLKNIKRYILDEVYNPIELDDIINVMNNVKFCNEDSDIPFPQADTFYRVLDLLNELNNNEMSALEISELYQFEIRQAHYYLSAGKYLGFIEKNSSAYKLSDYGKSIMKMSHKEKNLSIVAEILKHKPFYFALESYLKDYDYDRAGIAKCIKENSPNVNEESTAVRRTSTVRAWVNWIIQLSTNYDEIDI
ncbi:MAG: hypothetical protein IKL65_04935 [Bacilli bacterium]|nr:hypothetical protein [Bacilli bacterium]